MILIQLTNTKHKGKKRELYAENYLKEEHPQ